MKTGKNTTIFFRLSYLVISIILISLLFWGLIKCSDSSSKIPPEQTPEIQLNSFGFYSDSLDHQTYSVEKNETLSDILLNLGVPVNGMVNIIDEARKILDVRKIVAGNIYHSFTNSDSVNTLVYFVYEKSPKRFVVFDLRDSINVYESEKEVLVKENQKSATIRPITLCFLDGIGCLSGTGN